MNSAVRIITPRGEKVTLHELEYSPWSMGAFNYAEIRIRYQYKGAFLSYQAFDSDNGYMPRMPTIVYRTVGASVADDKTYIDLERTYPHQGLHLRGEPPSVIKDLEANMDELLLDPSYYTMHFKPRSAMSVNDDPWCSNSGYGDPKPVMGEIPDKYRILLKKIIHQLAEITHNHEVLKDLLIHNE